MKNEDKNHNTSEHNTLYVSYMASNNISSSNILSYLIVAGSTMLAFYFAFQATWIANFPSISTAILSNYKILSREICVAICLSIVFFNVWSYWVIRVMINYVQLTIRNAAEAERVVLDIIAPSNAEATPVFQSFMQNMKTRAPYTLRITELTLIAISMIWISFAISLYRSW